VLRWHFFLGGRQNVSLRTVAAATGIGFMANVLLPLRAGDLIRPYALNRLSDVDFGKALATSAGLARVFDLIGLSFLLLLSWITLAIQPLPPGRVISTPSGPELVDTPTAENAESEPLTGQNSSYAGQVHRGGLFFAAAGGVAMALLLLIAFYPAKARKVGDVCVRVLPQRWRSSAQDTIHSMTDALQLVRNWRAMVIAFLYSASMWVAVGMGLYLMARGLGLNIGISGAFVAVLATALAVALPQGPGYIGPFHAAVMFAAVSFGAPPGEAGALAVLAWLVHTVPITVVGLAFLWHEGFSLRGLLARTPGAGDGDTLSERNER
jgi:hypothetical protein